MIRANIIDANFAHNYRNAVGSQDNELADELVLNEIASLIETKPMTIIQIMNMFGLQFTGSTNGDLVKAVVKAMQVSPKFRVALSMLILLNNGLVTVEDVVKAGQGDLSAFRNSIKREYQNAEGGGGGGDMVSSIISAVGGITSSSLQFAAAKANQKSTQIAAQSGLDIAKTNAESSESTSREATRTELLKTLGIKYASDASGKSAGMPGWVIGAIVVLIGAVGAYLFLSNQTRGGSAIMPGAQPRSPAVVKHEQGGSIEQQMQQAVAAPVVAAATPLPSFP